MIRSDIGAPRGSTKCVHRNRADDGCVTRPAGRRARRGGRPAGRGGPVARRADRAV